jgi:hypothetical protein
VHGYRCYDFHEHCDGKPETVTLVQSLGENGLQDRVFGGYTPLPWDGRGAYVPEPGTGRPVGFLFNLNPGKGGPPRRYEMYGGSKPYAIFCGPNYGPIFGNGHDLVICDQCDQRADSYTKCGTGYTTGGSDEDKYFHTVEKFKVREIEVFQLTE